MQRSLNFSQTHETGIKLERRVVLHLDMDCFYCQVEQVRLGIPDNVPLAVQQWESVIAVNYAARAARVTRHASFRECFQQCPELQLVHVPTFSTRNPAAGLTIYNATTKENVQLLDRSHHKASLQPYREASLKVFATTKSFLEKYSVPFIIEKASVDEVYIDVSDIVDFIMVTEYDFVIQKGGGGRLVRMGRIPPDLDWSNSGKPAVVDTDFPKEEASSLNLKDQSNPEELSNAISDFRIYLGCSIAKSLRSTIFNELSFTVSAGIANNKTLSKLASAQHKPNQQTFVKKTFIPHWMAKVPFNKIRFLGGKMGKLLVDGLEEENFEASDEASDGDERGGGEPSSLSALEYEEDKEKSAKAKSIVVMASELWPLSLKDLERKLGDANAAKWAFGVIRGKDPSPITPRIQPKTFTAAKNMPVPLKEWYQVHDWLTLLVTELIGRLGEEFQTNGRWPQSITIHFNKPYEKSKTRTLDFPFTFDQLPEKNNALVDICLASLSVAHKEASTVLPCARLALGVTRLRTISFDNRKRSTTLDSFIRHEGKVEHDDTNSIHQHLDLILFNLTLVLPPESPLQGELKASEMSGKKKMKRRDLTSFFPMKSSKTIPPDDGNHDPGLYTTCPDCGQNLRKDDSGKIQEHSDYHFALGLQKGFKS